MSTIRLQRGTSHRVRHTAIHDEDLLEGHASPYLIFTQIGAHWRARASLKKLFVFGDSYSSKLCDARKTISDRTRSRSVSDDDATWVDFLASSVASRSASVVVNNFAFPGATVARDLDGQLVRFFDEFSTKIESEEATFVFFLGINDCGRTRGEDLTCPFEILFDAIYQLYIDASARNFILVDVPPTDRSPAAIGTTAGVARRIAEWNASLVNLASDFSSNSTEATMLVFSSNKVLSEVLDDPSAQGFAERARDVVGRGIWRDGIHLTSAVHKIIASRMWSALGVD